MPAPKSKPPPNESGGGNIDSSLPAQIDDTKSTPPATWLQGAAAEIERQHQKPKPPAPDGPHDSEDALALIFADRHADGLRYVAEWNRWLQWNGTRWCRDRTELAFDYSREICRDAATKANASDRKRLASAATVAAVARLARADRRIAAATDEWDANANLLNTPGGVVHLPSGEIWPPDPSLQMTKMTAVAPGDTCPRWLDFLDQITGSNQPLVDYLQRVVGYSLTGHTKEHALFFGHGPGANGKSVFLNAIRAIMADYATPATMETFMTTRTEQHPTGIASLRGARLVMANETESGRAWAESRIKALTGGDPMQARFMRADFFEFTPEFKLFVVGNHKPALANVDEAIRRRLHLIPFTVTMPPEARDEDLPNKLQSEWPGILLWAIEGALLWHEYGLAPPEIVRNATAEYFEEQDAIAGWIAGECETEGLPDFQRENTRDLFASWSLWAKAAGEQPGTSKWFSEQLQNRGFPKKREGHTGTRGFAGIRLKRPDYSDQEGW
jgi:putative DNA primase/helicase